MIDVIFLLAEERNENNKSGKVVVCTFLLTHISFEALRKPAHDVLKFLHITRLSACDYRERLPTIEKFKEVGYNRTTDRLSGSDLAPVAILRRGNTPQEGKHMLFVTIGIDVIRHQLKLVKPEQVLFRPTVIDTALSRGRSSHHIFPSDTPYGRQIYKLVGSEEEKSSQFKAIWDDSPTNGNP